MLRVPGNNCDRRVGASQEQLNRCIMLEGVLWAKSTVSIRLVVLVSRGVLIVDKGSIESPIVGLVGFVQVSSICSSELLR